MSTGSSPTWSSSWTSYPYGKQDCGDRDKQGSDLPRYSAAGRSPNVCPAAADWRLRADRRGTAYVRLRREWRKRRAAGSRQKVTTHPGMDTGWVSSAVRMARMTAVWLAF